MTAKQTIFTVAALVAALAGTTQADVFTAVTNGNIVTETTWGIPAPAEGDTNIWASGAFVLSAVDSNVFHGLTLRIDAGGSFKPNLGANLNPNDVTVNDMVLDGGLIDGTANQTKIIWLGGHTLTLNSGTIKSGDASNKDLTIRGGQLAGSGTISIIGTTAAGNSTVSLALMTSINGFSGIFDVKSNGRLNLKAVAVEDANFGMIVSGTGRYENSQNVAFTSLVLNGETIAAGSYAYTNLSATAQVVVVPGGVGIITVVDGSAATGYVLWAAENELAGDDALRTADPDDDGMDNLLEYSLGGNPNTNDAALKQPDWSASGSNMDYIYTRRTSDDSLSYDIMVHSNGLTAAATAIGDAAVIGTGVVDADFETVTNQFGTAESSLFVTLNVTETP